MKRLLYLLIFLCVFSFISVHTALADPKLTCIPVGGSGTQCGQFDGCAAGFFCRGLNPDVGSFGACMPQVANGESCWSKDDGVADPSLCTSGYCNMTNSSNICQAQGKQGDSCDPANQPSCGPNLYCQQTGSNKNNGQCSPALAKGANCRNNNTSDGICQSGLYCDDNTGTCTSQLTAGQTCTSDGDCQNGLYCKGAFGGGTGTCAKTVTAGSSCSLGDECQSGYTCSNASFTPLPTYVTPPPPPCVTNAQGDCVGVNTGLGVLVPTSITGTISVLFAVLLSIAGLAAITIIILSGYRIMLSQGDPEKIKGAKEALTSAIIGLLFMIFAVAILQIIGVDILRIPGFMGQ